jgi:hypothetical protein
MGVNYTPDAPVDEPRALSGRLIRRGLPSRYHADGALRRSQDNPEVKKERGDTYAPDPLPPPDPHGRRGLILFG